MVGAGHSDGKLFAELKREVPEALGRRDIAISEACPAKKLLNIIYQRAVGLIGAFRRDSQDYWFNALINVKVL